MKQSIAIIVCLALFIVVGAQTKKGAFYSELNVGFSYAGSVQKYYTSEFTDSEMGFSISPMAGYIVANNIHTGLKLEYTYAISSETPQSKGNFGSLLVGPFAKYYFNISPFQPFAYVDFGYLSAKHISREDYKLENSFSGFGCTIGGGASYKINKIFLLNAMLRYQYNYSVNKNDKQITYTSGGVNFNIGCSYYF